MRDLVRILALPPVLLALLAVSAAEASPEPQWPYEIPAHARYFPEEAHLMRRGLSALDKLANTVPKGMRKMSGDANEKFFLDYWEFEEEASEDQCPVRRSVPEQPANLTLTGELLPPLLLHADSPSHARFGAFSLFSRSSIFKRDFQCPNGTNACTSIGAPNICCATDETCVPVTNTDGVGDVGCCPNGQTCNGQVSGCDTEDGFTSCPGDPNGGCCIPDYVCYGIGCAYNSTSTTTTTITVATVTSCPPSYVSCPASLGGGCCTSGADCVSGATCQTSSGASTFYTTITNSGSVTAVAPARPTGSSGNATYSSTAIETSPSITSIGTQVIGICPTNYYFCSAYYRPGCCRVGRDCALSDCPAAASSSTFVSNGVTIVEPEGSTTGGATYYTTGLITNVGAVTASAFGEGKCQSGWQSCAQTIGGGCCPGDFACGTAVCSATYGATGVVSKIAPNSASGLKGGVMLWLGTLSLGCAIGMVVL